jgi:hypothetical protein
MIKVASDIAAGEHLTSDLIDHVQRIVSAGENALADFRDPLGAQSFASAAIRLSGERAAGIGDLHPVSTPGLATRRLASDVLIAVAGLPLHFPRLIGSQDFRTGVDNLHMGQVLVCLYVSANR